MRTSGHVISVRELAQAMPGQLPTNAPVRRKAVALLPLRPAQMILTSCICAKRVVMASAYMFGNWPGASRDR